MGDVHVPGRRDRAIASTVSALTALGLYLVVTVLLGIVVVLVFAREGIGLAWAATVAGGDVMRQAATTVDAQVPAWASWGVLVVGGLLAWLGSARFGRGLVGDPVGSIKALGPDGEPVTRGRTLLRAGVPVLVGVMGVALGVGPAALLVLVLCAAVAAFREDRRGPFELLGGVHLASTDAVKIDRDVWRARQRATKAAASVDEQPAGT